MAKDEDEVRAAALVALRDEFQRRTGCDMQDAEDVIATIIAGWPEIAEGKLPRVVTLVAEGIGAEPAQLVLCLHLILALERDPIGRELVFIAGCRTAVRWGVSPQLAKLLEQCAVTEKRPGERGH